MGAQTHALDASTAAEKKLANVGFLGLQGACRLRDLAAIECGFGIILPHHMLLMWRTTL
jgi:hypothetical protein